MKFLIPIVMLLGFAVSLFVVYSLGKASGYMDGLHDGWWRRDSGQSMYLSEIPHTFDTPFGVMTKVYCERADGQPCDFTNLPMIKKD